jgi:hypothetical protein
MKRSGYETNNEDAANIVRRIMFDTSTSSKIESFCVEELVNFMLPLQGSTVTKIMRERTASKHDFTRNFN